MTVLRLRLALLPTCLQFAVAFLLLPPEREPRQRGHIWGMEMLGRLQCDPPVVTDAWFVDKLEDCSQRHDME